MFGTLFAGDEAGEGDRGDGRAHREEDRAHRQAHGACGEGELTSSSKKRILLTFLKI